MSKPYVPESTEASCATCGENIEYMPNSPIFEHPWVNVQNHGSGMDICYDEEPHIPTFDVVCRRDGAASRTADELCAVFILDVAWLIIETLHPEYHICGGLLEECPYLCLLEKCPYLSARQRDDIVLAAGINGWCEALAKLLAEVTTPSV